MDMFQHITSDNPCGDDIKYDDQYIEIETEIEKNFNVSNTGETKWDLIVRKCEDLLSSRTKDLKLLSYWLYAQKRLNGWDDFFISFETYTKLLHEYNQALYPKTEKRKIKIFEWLENILEKELLEALESFTQDQLTYLSEILQSFKTTMPLTISTEETFFNNSQKRCLEILAQTEEKKKEETKLKEENEKEIIKQQEEKSVLEEAQKIRRSEEEEILEKFSSSNISAITNYSESLCASDIDECFKSVVSLSSTLLEKSPHDYFSYKLLFSLGEMLIEESFINKDTMNDDFVPSDDIIYVSRELEGSKISATQLNALIEQLLIRPTWIEGYFIVSKILFKLTRKEDALKVENMLFYFLYKEQEMLNKAKMIPEAMNEWLQTKILSLNDAGEGTIEYKHAYQEVLKVKKEQSEKNALMILEDYYQKSTNNEARFRWKLLFIDFALEISDKKLALSLLLELEKIIELHTIDQWQPELAIITYETFLKPILAQELKDEVKDRIYNKLSILDVKKVIKLH